MSQHPESPERRTYSVEKAEADRLATDGWPITELREGDLNFGYYTDHGTALRLAGVYGVTAHSYKAPRT